MRPLVLAAFLLLAGCVGAEPAPASIPIETDPVPPSETVAQEPTLAAIPLGQDGTIPLFRKAPDEVRINGTGWARIELLAQEAITLTPQVHHETMQDLELFSRDGDGIHSHRNYTFLYVFPNGSNPLGADSWYWNWWATPNWSVWPHSSSLFDRTSVRLAKNETGVLLIASTVPGYSIRLGTGASDDAIPYVAELGPRPGHVLYTPAAQEKATLRNEAARVGHERLWTTGWTAVEPSIVLAKSWTETRSPTAYAGAGADQLQIRRQSENPAAPPIPLPAYTVLGQGFEARTLTGILDAPTTIEMRRFLREDDAGIKDVSEGAAFLTIPSGPPEAP